jgi:ubiquitin-like modifier-activating enzyme ATG7
VFEDCVKGGKPKAEAAAEALKKIFPGVVSCCTNKYSMFSFIVFNHDITSKNVKLVFL